MYSAWMKLARHACAALCLLTPWTLSAPQKCDAAPLASLPPGVAAASAIVFPASGSYTLAGEAAGARVVPPVALQVNGASAVIPPSDSLSVAHAGYDSSRVSIRYALNAPAPGVYEIWTAFTLGGVAEQEFHLSAGGSEATATERATWKQSNGVSWQLDWRKAGPQITIYPQDRALTIRESGMASGHKQIVAVVLSRVANLPGDMDEHDGTIRAEMESWRPAQVSRRLYLLEGDKASTAARLCEEIHQQANSLQTVTSARVYQAAQARFIADKIGIAALPALIVMDDAYGIRAICRPSDSSKRIEAALQANTPLDVDVPKARAESGNGAELNADGSPNAWIVAGEWCGPSGLSLWGLDAEAETAPSLNDPCIALQFDTVIHTSWQSRTPGNDGIVVIDPATRDFVWSKGTAYACIYLKPERERDITLHLSQSGVETAGWINGQQLSFQRDASAAATPLPLGSSTTETVSTTDQGNRIHVRPAHPEGPVYARVPLNPGWNRLLVKLIMQNRDGEAFFFRARLTTHTGAPATSLRTSQVNTSEPSALHDEANRVQPIITTDAPFNLVYSGHPLRLRVSLKRLATANETAPVIPLISIRARLAVDIRDYDGKSIARRAATIVFPGIADFDMGAAPPTGYYSVHLSLTTPNGAQIAAYPPDGFSVIAGTAAQKARATAKKMATTYYWMDDGRSSTLYFPYMERMGFYRNVGGNPGPCVDLYREASRRGLHLAGDLWSFDSPDTVNDTVSKISPYVDSFKSFNEVDIVPNVRGTAEHWTAVTRAHYEAVKAASPKALVLSASLVRPAADSWFKDCLALGIDRYVDVWDVHCYPKNAPILEGSMSNSETETELGLLKCYAELGRGNDKPFWIGETGARSCHGADARRWQADMVAKMAACANSRRDFERIGFLIPWNYARAESSLGDIEAGHMPAEASYYTAGALIDGLPYSRLDLGAGIQAARFGPTTMLWTTGAAQSAVVHLDPAKRWLAVDVVGRVTLITVPASGDASVHVTSSPRYLLSETDYRSLTAF
ncbi:MAG: hypothetical protein P4L33_07205 [Capsulimonadaceae bacterium]|nr:hypothetical protein [Capsulimonadaceae bacterium]